MSATVSSSSPTTRVVLPAVDESVDRSSLANLIPSNNATLQYAENNNGTLILTLNANLTVPQVTLENLNCVALIDCSSTELEIGFASQECYDLAVATWEENMVFITNQAGCNPPSERGLYQVVDYQYGFVGKRRKREIHMRQTTRAFPWRITANARPVRWEDIAESLEVGFGQTSGEPGGEESTSYTQTITSRFSRSRPASTVSTTSSAEASSSSAEDSSVMASSTSSPPALLPSSSAPIETSSAALVFSSIRPTVQSTMSPSTSTMVNPSRSPSSSDSASSIFSSSNELSARISSVLSSSSTIEAADVISSSSLASSETSLSMLASISSVGSITSAAISSSVAYPASPSSTSSSSVYISPLVSSSSSAMQSGPTSSSSSSASSIGSSTVATSSTTISSSAVLSTSNPASSSSSVMVSPSLVGWGSASTWSAPASSSSAFSSTSTSSAVASMSNSVASYEETSSSSSLLFTSGPATSSSSVQSSSSSQWLISSSSSHSSSATSSVLGATSATSSSALSSLEPSTSSSQLTSSIAQGSHLASSSPSSTLALTSVPPSSSSASSESSSLSSSLWSSSSAVSSPPSSYVWSSSSTAPISSSDISSPAIVTSSSSAMHYSSLATTTSSVRDPVASIYSHLVASAAFNDSNLVLKPITLSSTADLEKVTNVNDTTYQNQLLYRVQWDALSPAQNLVTDSVNALNALLGNATAFANIASIANVTLAADSSLIINGMKKRGNDLTARDITSIAKLQMPRASKNMPKKLSDIELERRAMAPAGWETFFDLLGNTLSSAVCDSCGTIVEAIPHLSSAIKCLFGECALPRRADSVQSSFLQDTKLNVSFPANSLVYQNGDTRVTCVKCSLTVSSLRIEGRLAIIPKNRTIQSATVMVTQYSTSDLLFNVSTSSWWHSRFEVGAASMLVDSIMIPGVLTFAPQFLFGFGMELETNTALSYQAGISLATTGGAAEFDVSNLNNLQGKRDLGNWSPNGTITHPRFDTIGRTALTSFIRTSIQISMQLFDVYSENVITLSSETTLALDAQVLSLSPRKRDVGPLEARAPPPGLISQLITPPICPANRLRITTNLKYVITGLLGHSPLRLFEQTYAFGSQCIALPPRVVPSVSSSTISLSSSSALSSSSTSMVPFTSSLISSSSSSMRSSAASSSFSSSSLVTSSSFSLISSAPSTLLASSSSSAAAISSSAPAVLDCTTCGPIILNGGFESNMLAPWTRTDTSAASFMFAQHSAPRNGRYLLITVGSGQRFTMEQTIRVIPGKRYYAAVSYRHSLNGNSNKQCYFYADVRYVGLDGSTYGNTWAASTPMNDPNVLNWQDFTTSAQPWSFSSPEECTVRIVIDYICSVGHTNTLWLDDIKITQTDDPTKSDNCVSRTSAMVSSSTAVRTTSSWSSPASSSSSMRQSPSSTMVLSSSISQSVASGTGSSIIITSSLLQNSSIISFLSSAASSLTSSNSASRSTAILSSTPSSSSTATAVPASGCANCGAIITNGDFESQSIANWTRYDNTAGQLQFQQHTAPRTGYYLAAPASGSPSIRLFMLQALRVIPNEAYTVSISYRVASPAAAGTGSCFVQMYWQGSQSGYLLDIDPSVSPAIAQGWQEFSTSTFTTGTGTLRSGSCSATLRLGITCSGSQSNILHLDDVKVTPVNDATELDNCGAPSTPSSSTTASSWALLPSSSSTASSSLAVATSSWSSSRSLSSLALPSSVSLSSSLSLFSSPSSSSLLPSSSAAASSGCTNCGAIITNGDFESRSLQGWTRYDSNSANNPVSFISQTSSRPGWFMAVSSVGNSNTWLYMQQTLRVVPGKQYRVSFSYRYTLQGTNNRNCYFGAEWYGSGNYVEMLYTSAAQNIAIAQAWQDFSFTSASVKSTGCTANLDISFACATGHSNSLYLDDVKITQIDAPSKIDNC